MTVPAHDPTDLAAFRAEVAELLDLPADGISDAENLIALGLDSIAMMQLAAGLRRRGRAVSFGDLAAEPTLAAWGALLGGGAAVSEVDSMAAGTARGESDVDEGAPFPLALMQHAYWVGRRPGQRLGGVAAHFYDEFDGRGVDPHRLEDAVRAVLRRHGMLRVRILDDGTQRILPASPWPGLTTHDLRGLSTSDAEAELELIRAELSHRRLDITAGEVFDVRLSLLPGGRTRVHVNLDMIAADALSLRVLLADLARHYLGEGEPEPLAYGYPRYLADRAARRSAADAAADREHWRTRLPELPGQPELPAAGDSADDATVVVRRHRLLGPDEVARWETAARGHGLTPAMALAAVFAETLTAWSAQPRFLLNLPLFDREPLHPDVAGLVGDFTSSVLLEWDGAAPGTFAERAGRVQERFHADAAHAGHSGVEVLRDLSRARGEQQLAPVVYTSALGLGPLFPDAVRRAFGEASWIISQGPQVWLDAQVTELDGGLLVNWDAREHAFAPGVLDAMFTAYSDLLDRLLADDAAWTAPPPRLAPDAQLTARAPGGDAPEPRCLHTDFFRHAHEDPGAIALRWGRGGELSYGDLAGRALTLAGALRARGAGPGELVAISLPKGPEQVVAALGVLATGAAYLPLPVDHPPARRERVLASAGARIVVDADFPVHGAAPLPAPAATAPRDLAYVLYTSGSTGEPKGVEITHAAAMNTIGDLVERFGLDERDRTLAVSRFEFDLSVFDVFAPLSVGGAVVCVEQDAQRDATSWLDSVHRHGVTVLNCVPTLLDMLLTACDERPLPLRAVLLGGDRVGTDLPGRLAARAPGCRFAGLGGTTETAIHSTVQEVVGDAVPASWSCVPYGEPLRGVSCRVVDALGRDCPDQVPGELWIGGAGVARGYRNDPERTADRFVEHAGVRWYRTGDRARYLPDGGIEFLGRADHQVKIRGHRVELGGVEAALAAAEGVTGAVAVLTGGRLGAAVTGAADPERVRAALAERLPAHMRPDLLVVLPAFPLTTNGKLDRAAVATAVAEQDTAVPERISPPRGAVEPAVAAAWRDVLDVAEVGREQDFFALGGDSLLATRVVARLRADGFAGAGLGALFESPVLADFAAVVGESAAEVAGSAAASSGSVAPAVRTDPAARFEPFPPTDVQLAYWLGRADGFTLGGVGCHFYREYDVPDLDVPRLEEAANRLIARHEMLRAVFDERGEQRVLPSVGRFRIAVTDAGDDPERAFAELRETWSHHVFDSAHWPLFGIAACRAGDRTRLAIGMDNLVLDALSILHFYAELAALYADPDAELPPVGLSFRDYVLGAEPDPAELAAAREHWARAVPELPPAPELPLAVDPARVVRPRFTRRAATIDAADWAVLAARSAEHGVTPSAVLLTAFAEVLGQWSARPDLTLNLTLFDRREVHPDVQRVFGDFTSLLLVACRPEAADSWLDRTRRVQGELWQALDHRSVSAVQVLRELAKRTGAAEVTMPVVFTSALGVSAGTEPGDPFGEQVWGITQTPQVWLDHQVVERSTPGGTCVDLNWDAVEELFPADVLDEMFDAYLRLLAHLVRRPWRDRVPELLPAAQRAARERVNDTAAPEREPLLHAPFFRRATEDPAAVAVLGDEGELARGALAERALRIAALLRDRGVEPGAAVAISLPKGVDQIAAALGVLAAGAHYVPIGVDQPAVRRDRILGSAGVALAIVEDEVDFPVPTATVAEAAAGPVAEPVAVDPESLAYVIFTSGSTGEPKGVEITHRAAANTVEDVVRRFGIGSRDRVLAVSALEFDLSVFDLFGLLGAGGAVVSIAEDERRAPRRWAESAARHGVTVWNSVPMLLDVLLDVVDGGAPTPAALRLALLSGDWVGLDLPDRLRAAVPGADLVALGGATEAAIWSNAFEVSGVDSEWRSIPYGFPLRNQRFRVVDELGRDRPEWVPGELWIGGTGVARGYRGSPELTAAKFLDDGEHRWYRTGDLGRYRPGGLLEFLGRRDDQVKVRGYRVELGEVESVVAEHPAASRALAATAGDGSSRRVVVGVLPGEVVPDPAEIRAWCADRLPVHMLPDQVLLLDEVPTTANGKLDRARVAELAAADDGVAEPPAGPVEQAVAAAWSELLRTPVTSRDANFFGLGGDSVQAIRFIELARRELDVELELAQLFITPTVRSLAEHVAELGAEEVVEGAI
ncbi:non-ribosomal peptide synthetase [Saccharopolyspora sp. 7B]|uniref:non-ribosomal peptide synthetase n=1 Tax=Saccharopolyspora sp. 7B TaxID=2877240 RepID=UPI001CD738A4|nr:non-ribosomal peptide synthetase [Saccharopolyspora sp. 7B]MCA1278157.1 amino acid adenylation domain-containing protein [Saccharopolyspora sp. 7B]